MPSYPKGTRQWAEARMAELQPKLTQNSWEDALYPDGAPTYSREELEAAGQEVMF